ncbi:hypothetical protein QK289_15390 [Exiguobacterium antarcticum]|uniref:Uncharacterized protein n=1 Tax=Exiguobacterium antarcticum TaxID=132920 RepID=A0ABT6R6D8_9BACL|nr:hypothetical protein [Exiguobacterium antarcticum]MDI3236398.1 hypothetical protein [Exiguobacterium antarcticum]
MEAFEKRQYEKRLREYPEYFEFCLVQDYEAKYVGERLYTFDADEVSLQCFVQGPNFEVISIIFPKQLFEREFLLQWLSYFGIHVGAAGKAARVPNAASIDRSYLFFDHIVTRYVKGQDTITVKRVGMEEWTDYNRPLVEKILDKEGRRIPIPMVVLNDEIFPECPRLKFDRKVDAVVVNGTIMNIDRIDEYGDGIGFYRKNIREPIAFMENEDVVIVIDVFEDSLDGGKICQVTYMPMFDPSTSEKT